MQHPKNIINFVNLAQLFSVINKRKPLGKFISVDLTGACIAVDNTTGEAWEESFPIFADAISYLDGPKDNTGKYTHLMATMDLPEGSQYDGYKIFLSSYYIYRKSENEYIIDRTTSGWVSAYPNREMLFRILSYQASIEDLHFT